MYQQECPQSEKLEASSLTLKQKWGNLHPWLRRTIIIGAVLLLLSIITTVVLIAVVLSWKPTCTVMQQANYPVPGTSQQVVVKSVKVQEKMLTESDVNFGAQVTTIKDVPRLLQEDEGVPYPSIITIDNGQGVIVQAVTPVDTILYIDPDKVIASYTPSRLLQSEGTAADPNNNLFKFDDPLSVRKGIEDSLLRAAAANMGVNEKDLVMTYEETVTMNMKADGSYELEKKKPQQKARLLKLADFHFNLNINININNNNNNNNQNSNNNRNNNGNGSRRTRSYYPDIAKTADVQFSEQIQILVAVELPKNNTLQQDPTLNNRANPIRYQNNNNQNSTFKVIGEAAYNCSVQCTGEAGQRVCPIDLLAEDKCGYKVGNLTGEEKVSGRYVVKYNPELAEQLRRSGQGGVISDVSNGGN